MDTRRLQTAVHQHQGPVRQHQAPVQRHQGRVRQRQAPVQRHQAPVQRHQAPVQHICVTQTRVNSFDELEIGDHLVFHRTLYDHHGILTRKLRGRFHVVEAAKTGPGLIKLKLSWQKLDSEEGGVSVASYLDRIIPRRETVIRAQRCYEKSTKDPDFYKYNLFSNNCEHFATYCATGRMYSLQVIDFRSRPLLSYIKERLKFKLTRTNEQSKHYICIPCENTEIENDVYKRNIITYLDKDI